MSRCSLDPVSTLQMKLVTIGIRLNLAGEIELRTLTLIPLFCTIFQAARTKRGLAVQREVGSSPRVQNL
jgi:hypothetical protein